MVPAATATIVFTRQNPSPRVLMLLHFCLTVSKGVMGSLVKMLNFREGEVVCPGHTAGRRMGWIGTTAWMIPNLFSSRRLLHLLNLIHAPLQEKSRPDQAMQGSDIPSGPSLPCLPPCPCPPSDLHSTPALGPSWWARHRAQPHAGSPWTRPGHSTPGHPTCTGAPPEPTP